MRNKVLKGAVAFALTVVCILISVDWFVGRPDWVFYWLALS